MDTWNYEAELNFETRTKPARQNEAWAVSKYMDWEKLKPGLGQTRLVITTIPRHNADSIRHRKVRSSTINRKWSCKHLEFAKVYIHIFRNGVRLQAKANTFHNKEHIFKISKNKSISGSILFYFFVNLVLTVNTHRDCVIKTSFEKCCTTY